MTTTGTYIGKARIVGEEEHRTAGPTIKGSTGGACQEGRLGTKGGHKWRQALLPVPELGSNHTGCHGCLMQTLALMRCRVGLA